MRSMARLDQLNASVFSIFEQISTIEKNERPPFCAHSSRHPFNSPEVSQPELSKKILFAQGRLIHAEESECVLAVFDGCIMGSDMWEALEPH